MCLILFSYKNHPKYKLIVAANRDEFYHRPTEPLQRVDDNVLCGIDKQCGGTWLGITHDGRFAAVTNFRAPDKCFSGAWSRGGMVTDYLRSDFAADDFMAKIAENRNQYNPFNCLACDDSAMYWFSNMAGEKQARALTPGVYGLCNDLLDVPWPKVTTGKAAFASLIQGPSVDKAGLFQLLEDTQVPPDNQLPETGVGLTWERILAPVFIHSDLYGTRSSAIILADYQGNIEFTERTWCRDDTGGFHYEDRTLTSDASSGCKKDGDKSRE